jgi:hypothetical protein
MPQTLVILIDQLAGFPDWLSQKARDVPNDQLRWKPELAEFSWTAQLCHLRDVEREGHMLRIARMLEEEMPVLVGVDGSRLAAERNYDGQSAGRALDAFRTFRALSIAMLREAGPRDFERRGLFGKTDELTLAELVERMAAHDTDHRGQIEQLIASGRDDGIFPAF